MAQHDSLTHLVNRETFRDKLQEAVVHTQRSGRHCALMSLDLTGIAQVNETYGREAGDTVLCELARRIQASVREQDTVARLGGDEFAIVVEDLDDPQACGYVARRLLQITSLPVLLPDDVEAKVQLSIGVALCSSGSLSPAALVHAAESALRIAKSLGSGYHVHTSAEESSAEPRNAV